MGGTASGTMPDRELVDKARAGDRQALADLAGRWADRLYNHCRYLRLRREDEARELTLQGLATAARTLDQLREPGRFGGWLFAIAHREAARMPPPQAARDPEASGDAGGEAELADMAMTLDPGLRREVTRLAWQAAAALAQVDRELLNLSYREGFRPVELAMITGLDPAVVRQRLSRSQEHLERTLGALLVARFGEGDGDELGPPCAELAALLAEQGWDGRLAVTGTIRRVVSRHADRCATCAARRRLLVTPELLLPPPVPLPSHLRDRLLSRVQLAANGVPVLSVTPGPPVAATRTRAHGRSAARAAPAFAPAAAASAQPHPAWPQAPSQASQPRPAAPARPSGPPSRPQRVLRWLRLHAKAVVLAVLLALFVWLGGWLLLQGQPRPFTPEGSSGSSGQPPAATSTFNGSS